MPGWMAGVVGQPQANSRIRSMMPAQVLVLGFAVLISAGTLVLMLPVSAASGRATPLPDALFTATSAVCVTGLIVVNTAEYWSRFGQLVILLLLQAGGLGIMTMSTLFALLIGRRITFRERLWIQEAIAAPTLSGVVRLTKAILAVTALLEGIGAVLLTARFSFDYPLPTALLFGLFHSVSAFCNAGFDLLGTSFTGYVEDAFVNIVLMLLILVGGIGFIVIVDVYENRRSLRRLSLHSKLVLLTSAVLLVLGTIFVMVVEWNNPHTMGGLSLPGKILSALFHSVTPRTAGFNTLPTGMLMPATQLFTIALMFIGGSPGGTAGGIKTTTLAALVAAVKSTVAGKAEIEIFERRLPREVVEKALAITMMGLAMVVGSSVLLLLSEGVSIQDALFEATSAFGTVGLSTGLTGRLSTFGKLVVTVTMFTGRLGPLTLAIALAQRPRYVSTARLPEEKIVVG